MTEAELKAAVRDILRTLSAAVERAILRDLADPIDLGPSERFQFEACPHFFGIKVVQTEEEILRDSDIQEAIPQQLWDTAIAADLSVFECIEAVLPEWLADCWKAAGGPDHHSPAYLVYHGSMDEPRFDLERRRWCEVSEVWPDDVPGELA